MRVPFLAIALGAGLLLGRGAAFAKDPEPRAIAPKERADLVALFTKYLNSESEDAYKHRLPLVEYLGKLKETGYDPLGDLDTLTGIVYASRPFKPAYERKTVEKDDKVHADPLNRLTSVVLRASDGGADSLRMAFSLPGSYPTEPKKLNTTKPYPVMVTLHELTPDYQDAKGSKEWPGEEVIKRRYGKNGPLKAISDEWIVLAPVVARAQFSVNGKVNGGSIIVPLQQFWQRYHIDFDRVVLDGGEEALQLAASQPMWFGGLVVRSAEKLEFDPDLVKNFAHLSVYVVGADDCPAVKILKQGGFDEKNLKVGKEDGIAEWAKTVKRVVPKAFHWNVKDAQIHTLAHWINVNQVVDGASERTLDVEAVDTPADPNTIKIEAKGIQDITLFLSDRVVDLNRDVRILLNGSLARPPAKYERNLDKTFTSKRFNIVKSQYYGWLYPIVIEGVAVPEKAAPVKPPPAAMGGKADPGGAPTEEQETKAKFLMDIAAKFETNGELDKALKYYRQVLEQGETSVKSVAEAKVKELSEKAPK